MAAKGQYAETLARFYLRVKGYKIVAQNFITGRGTHAGEIDIIARQGKTIVFVEVKQRSTIENAAYAILPKQQMRIKRGAESFLQKHPHYAGYNIRFDAVLIKLPFSIRHIPNAF